MTKISKPENTKPALKKVTTEKSKPKDDKTVLEEDLTEKSKSEESKPVHKDTVTKNDKVKIYADYPSNIGEALVRYEKYKSVDCFPEIAPALLNSADIKAYVKQTGMIYPFDERELQSASYKVKIAGKIVYWKYNDGNDNSKQGIEKFEKELTEGDYFDLQPNSIAFVTMEPEFHIPVYLALRFNLKIKHIYKGLLLGTGPLVDPGFEGRLSIPLHNLTNNTYRFKYGDTLITMEFTKLSPNITWFSDCPHPGHSEEFIFEEMTPSRDVNKYIEKALDSDRLPSIISSIPDAINDSKKQAKEARDDVEKVKRNSTIITVGSVIGVLTVVLTSITLAFNAINKANERYDDILRENMQFAQEIDMLKNNNSEYLRQIDELNNRIDELIIKINEIKDDKLKNDESGEN